jgi:hypothetical protein
MRTTMFNMGDSHNAFKEKQAYMEYEFLQRLGLFIAVFYSILDKLLPRLTAIFQLGM